MADEEDSDDGLDPEDLKYLNSVSDRFKLLGRSVPPQFWTPEDFERHRAKRMAEAEEYLASLEGDETSTNPEAKWRGGRPRSPYSAFPSPRHQRTQDRQTSLYDSPRSVPPFPQEALSRCTVESLTGFLAGALGGKQGSRCSLF